MMRIQNWIGLAALAIASIAHADVKLPQILSDNMVLQQTAKVPIWGWATAGEKVHIALNDQQADTTADANGKWRVDLDLSKEPQGPFDMTVAGTNTLTVKNILIGQVWLCSGQSNMEFGIGNCPYGGRDMKAADHPTIRLCMVTRTPSQTPLDDVPAKWVVCSPKTIGQGGWWGFSAVGFYFGLDLNGWLNTPIGLIQDCWGGTPAEAFVPRETLKNNADLAYLLDKYPKAKEQWPQKQQDYQKQLTDWKTAEADRKTKGLAPTTQPKAPLDPDQSNQFGGVVYDGMIHPVQPIALAGVIWYQGESNGDRGYQYRTLFPLLIKEWRRTWEDENLPFLFVQLPSYGDVPKQPGHSLWAELREAQAMTLSLPHTGMAVTIDTGEPDNIHPKDKYPVGHRLALVALEKVYGKPVESTAPTYDSMKVDGDAIRIKLTHADGLYAKGGKISGFEIAGEDKKFVWADATIDGQAIVVHADSIQAPVAVRYAWAGSPQVSLYNASNLPAAPFRTDDWPGVSVKNK